MHRRRWPARALPIALVALTLSVGAMFVFGNRTTVDPAAAAPVDLNAPLGLTPADLHQWCLDRLAQGTRGLSTNARNWLRGCAEAFGPTPTPTTGPTSTPTARPTPTATRTPTPTPTTTVTAPPGRACAPNPSGCGFPDATNTGVPAGTPLHVVNGDLYVTTAGQVITGAEVHGCVFVQADNVTIRDSKVNCRENYGIRGFASGKDFFDLTLIDDEIDCGATNTTGVAYAHFTALRLNIHGCENGFAISDDATIRDTYVHNLFTGNGAHADGAQLTDGAGGITFEHNTLVAPLSNSAIIMWTQDDPQNHDVLVDRNLLVGGGWTLYCPRMDANNVRITEQPVRPVQFRPGRQLHSRARQVLVRQRG